MRPTLNRIVAEFDMTGRCVTCNKPIKRYKTVRGRTLRELMHKIDQHNSKTPFYCKKHKPTS